MRVLKIYMTSFMIKIFFSDVELLHFLDVYISYYLPFNTEVC